MISRKHKADNESNDYLVNELVMKFISSSMKIRDSLLLSYESKVA